MKKKFDLDDFVIPPSIWTNISSRKEINIYDSNNFLPLFTAPMFDVISDYNINIFKENKIYPIIPRKKEGEFTNLLNIYLKNKKEFDITEFLSVGLEEFKNFIDNNTNINLKLFDIKLKILIDIANGHMKDLELTIKKSKKIFGNNLILMVGNIAHPQTFFNLSEAGADFVRVSIGNGSSCLTAQQTAINYPLASLLYEISEMKNKNKKYAKIIADGGLKKYSDIIKALYLGADYCMLGGILNKSLESSSDIYLWNKIKINQKIASLLFKHKFKLYKRFRGMSTKSAQKQMGKNNLKTSEGTIKSNLVEYTLPQWKENFEHYLKSSMSYTDSTNLSEFKNNNSIIFITKNSQERFKK